MPFGPLPPCNRESQSDEPSSINFITDSLGWDNVASSCTNQYTDSTPKSGDFAQKKWIMWPFFVIQYVASLSFNPTILMEGNIEMKHLHTLPLQFLWCTKNATLGVIRILQKHPPKDPHPPAAANPFKTNEFQAAEPNLKAWLVSGSRASVLTQALSNLTILPAAETFNGGSSWCLDAYSGV